MTGPDPSVGAALRRLQAGDARGARAEAERAVAAAPRDAAALSLLGMLVAREGDPARGATLFERALAARPDDAAARVNLARALVATGAHDRAIRVCGEGARDPRLLRISGYARQQLGLWEQAAADYRAVLAAAPDDAETWNNLGNALAAAGDVDDAIDTFRRANRLRPELTIVHLNLAKLLASSERQEERLAVLRSAAAIAPADPDVQAELGLAEAATQDFAAAERAFREAVRLSAGFTPAYVELGLLLENQNRLGELEELLDGAMSKGVGDPAIGFLRAWLLRRRGRLEEALALAEAVPPTISGLRRHQLLADLHDRLGDEARAFAEWERMNAASLATAGPAPEPGYRQEVEAVARSLTPARVAAWTRAAVERAPPAPVFIAGFPRSGTTLLDTLLMNMPQLHVMEELPVFRQVEAMAQAEGLDPAAITTADADRLRRRYFEALAVVSPAPEGATVVDKYPLHMARAPLIHRVFPDAKLVLVERHPCDAVLSCFMANFTLNRAMREFTTLEGAARLYDRVFEAWTRARELLPLDVHLVRYERMVEDLEAEMRPLIAFMGVDWRDDVLDNQGAAAKRDHIRTASYAQVGEPIYRRAVARWERYRAQMVPVLPILAPWAERMGYSV